MNHRNRARLSKLSLALIAALAAAPAFAQSTSAGVGGHVVGANGQPVAGAEVTITHVESGTVSRAVTDANGNYSARGLRVGGPYTITIRSAAGTTNRENVYLGLNKVAEVDASLDSDVTTLGSVKVVGTIGADIFQSDNKGLGTLVTQRQLETTPQGNRTIDDIARLDPRIQVADQGSGAISANGLPNRYNNISVDGLSQGDPFGLNANGMPYTGSPISVDTIAEYDIATTDYDVTSDTVGANINAVTKSGTNEFHGSVYYAFRNASSMVGKLDGQKYTNFGKDTTTGFTLGGPLVKDKLFFFLAAEKQTVSDMASASTNNTAVADGYVTQDEVDQAIATATTLGLQPGTVDGLGADLEDKRYLGKLDWNINADHRASLTFQRTKETRPDPYDSGPTRVVLSSHWYISNNKTDSAALQLFSDWSDNFSTEAKLSYQKFEQENGNPINQPHVQINTANRGTIYLGEDKYRHENIIDTKKLTASVVGTWYLGDHVVKGGFEYQRNDIYNLFGQRQHGAYYFNSLADFSAGNYYQYELYQPGPGMTLDDVAAQWVYSQTSLFLQDTWQANDNLSLTYGVRANIPHSDHKPFYNPAFEAAFGYPNNNALDSSNKVIEPRLAFNYSFDTERKMQLRGGVGVFQTFPPTVWMTNPYQNNGLTTATFRLFDPAAYPFSPDPYNQNHPPITTDSLPTMDVDTISSDFKLPSVWKASLAYDAELPWWGVVGSVEWQYVKAKDAIYYVAPNIGTPSGALPDGRMQYWNIANNFGSGTNHGNNGDFTYDSTLLTNTNKGLTNSLTFGLSKPFGDDWSANVSATITHATDVNPGTDSQASSGYKYVVRTNPNEELSATADRSIRQSLKASLTWDHAFFGDYRTTVSAFYNGHSGLPYSWVYGYSSANRGDVNGDGIAFEDPAYIPLVNDPIVSYGSASPDQIAAFQDFINNDPYLSSHRGQIAGRNAARSPWVNQLDLGVQQELPGLFTGHKAVVRLDVYNFLNLLNNDWGVTRNVGSFNTRSLVGVDGITTDGQYIYNLGSASRPSWQGLSVYDASSKYPQRVVSRWSLLMTLRYEF